MLFVDGENFTIRAAVIANTHQITLAEGPHYAKDVFVWMPGLGATHVLAQPRKGNQLEQYAARAHYYTSLVGDDGKLLRARKALRALGFQPQVFKRGANQKKSKGVDVTLTKDLLVNAFHRNYDVAVIIAGDGDYVPVIEELKRMGRTVYVAFFTEDQAGLNEELRLCCDKFFTLSPVFVKSWQTNGTALGLSKPLREAVVE
jgi:uncharacterized LabA/DUF88 family protein